MNFTFKWHSGIVSRDHSYNWRVVRIDFFLYCLLIILIFFFFLLLMLSIEILWLHSYSSASKDELNPYLTASLKSSVRTASIHKCFFTEKHWISSLESHTLVQYHVGVCFKVRFIKLYSIAKFERDWKEKTSYTQSFRSYSMNSDCAEMHTNSNHVMQSQSASLPYKELDPFHCSVFLRNQKGIQMSFRSPIAARVVEYPDIRPVAGLIEITTCLVQVIQVSETWNSTETHTYIQISWLLFRYTDTENQYNVMQKYRLRIDLHPLRRFWIRSVVTQLETLLYLNQVTEKHLIS